MVKSEGHGRSLYNLVLEYNLFSIGLIVLRLNQKNAHQQGGISFN